MNRDGRQAALRLRAPTKADRPLILTMVRADYLEDGHVFHEDRQPQALAALVAGDGLACAWPIEVEGAGQGYIVLTWSFSVESGGRDGSIDELYFKPALRNHGLGLRVLDPLGDETRRLGLIRLEVEADNPALSLYRRAGFVDHDRHLLSKWLSKGGSRLTLHRMRPGEDSRCHQPARRLPDPSSS